MTQELKTMLKNGIEKWPLCGHYSELLEIASAKYKISVAECRKHFGLMTYREWAAALEMKGGASC